MLDAWWMLRVEEELSKRCRAWRDWKAKDGRRELDMRRLGWNQLVPWSPGRQ